MIFATTIEHTKEILALLPNDKAILICANTAEIDREKLY